MPVALGTLKKKLVVPIRYSYTYVHKRTGKTVTWTSSRYGSDKDLDELPKFLEWLYKRDNPKILSLGKPTLVEYQSVYF